MRRRGAVQARGHRQLKRRSMRRSAGWSGSSRPSPATASPPTRTTTAAVRSSTVSGTGDACLTCQAAVTRWPMWPSLATRPSMTSTVAGVERPAASATARPSCSTTQSSSASVFVTRRGAAHEAASAPLRTRARSSWCRTSPSRRSWSPPRTSSLTPSRRSGARLAGPTTGRTACTRTPTATGGALPSSDTRLGRARSGPRASRQARRSFSTRTAASTAWHAPSRTAPRSSSTTRTSTRRALAARRTASAGLSAPSPTAPSTRDRLPPRAKLPRALFRG
mmetsp:Transcript_104589/g.278291  ORF Transcript_104589/g.278291 Transcript_104589/m.278291 type:complete len:279 (+) Transcript_104589:177-1013(+)